MFDNMDARTIYSGKSKNGEDIVIRYPLASDAKDLMDYINTLSREGTFIRWQGEQISLQDEQKYLDYKIDRVRKNFCVHLIALSGDKIVGTSDIDLMNMTESHLGIFGITVAKDFRGEGIGTLLLEHILSEAKKYMPILRIVILKVYAGNSVAIKMYDKFGFKEYGRLPNGIHYKGGYVDEILMYKNIRE